MVAKCGRFQGSASCLTSGDPLGRGRGERVRLAPGGVRMGTLGCELTLEGRGSAEIPTNGEAHLLMVQSGQPLCCLVSCTWPHLRPDPSGPHPHLLRAVSWNSPRTDLA